jgi:hypothetical protein
LALGGASNVFAEQVSHQPQGHIDTGRDAGAGHHIAVMHKALVFQQYGLWCGGADEIEGTPMGGCALAIEEAGLADQRGARADRGLPGRCRHIGPEAFDEGRVGHQGARATAAWHNDNVGVRGVVESVVGGDAKSLGAADIGLRPADGEGIGGRAHPSGHPEHFPGADEVEFLDALENDDGDAGARGVTHGAMPLGQ